MSAKRKPIKKENPFIVGPETIGDALGITARRVQQLAKEGVFAIEGKRGRYNWKKCVLAYIKFLQESYQRPESKVNLDSVTLRGRELDNEDKELVIGERRGELIPLILLSNILDSFIPEMKAIVSAHSNKLKANCSREPNKTQTRIDESFNEILLELAAISADTLIDKAQAEIVSTAGKDNGESIRGQTPEAK